MSELIGILCRVRYFCGQEIIEEEEGPNQNLSKSAQINRLAVAPGS
jgi:hypothetical protein